jgi:hypothetical protein
MTGTRDALEQLRSTLAGVLAFDDAMLCSDDELLLTMGELEALGRLVDAHRAVCAGEVAERSRIELGDQRLSERKGCRSAVELIERVTQVSGFEARRRIALGAATRARAGFTGEPVGAVFPVVAAALAAGGLGADAAGTIIRELDRTRTVADPARFAAAEQALVAKTGRRPTTSGRCVAAGSGSAAPVTGWSRCLAS